MGLILNMGVPVSKSGANTIPILPLSGGWWAMIKPLIKSDSPAPTLLSTNDEPLDQHPFVPALESFEF